MEVNVIKLDNEKEYIIIDAIETDNDKYLYMANEEDELDMCLRKIIKKDGKDYLVELDSEEEFEEVVTMFFEKNKGEEGKNEK